VQDLREESFPLAKGSCEKIAFSNCTLEIPPDLPLQKGGKIRGITRYLFFVSLPSPFEKGGFDSRK
jgi:hypothetical protein